MQFNKCLRCGRPLKDPNSVRRGYGPVCMYKVNVKKNEMERIDKPTITDFRLAEGTRNKLNYRISELEYPYDTCHCGRKITKGVLCSYDHEDGVEAAGYGEKQWFYLHCNSCNYDYALWKLNIPMDDLTEKLEKMYCGCGAEFYVPQSNSIVNCPDCGKLLREDNYEEGTN